MTDFSAEDRAMNAAIEKARRSIPEFLAALRAGRAGERYFVKVPVAHFQDKGHEHLWVSDVRLDGDRFVGVVDSRPRRVPKPRQGDMLWIGQSEISDWIIMRGEKMTGGFTEEVVRFKRVVQELD